MNKPKLIVTAFATALVAGVVGFSYAQTSGSGSMSGNNVGDTGKSTKPASANETPGPSTNTQSAPGSTGANSRGMGSTTGSSSTGSGSMSSDTNSASTSNDSMSSGSRSSRRSRMSSGSGSSSGERTARADRG